MATSPAPPDLIFYDMFSTKTSGDQWTLNAFRKLFDACVGRAAELFTYSCSTANRVALLAAGFHVARGRSAGEKLETTIALTPAASQAPSSRRHDLLTADWLEKWNRSGAKFPGEIQEHQHGAFEQVIREHAQFQ
jgi:queuine tRNA-ribosyltransferase